MERVSIASYLHVSHRRKSHHGSTLESDRGRSGLLSLGAIGFSIRVRQLCQRTNARDG